MNNNLNNMMRNIEKTNNKNDWQKLKEMYNIKDTEEFEEFENLDQYRYMYEQDKGKKAMYNKYMDIKEMCNNNMEVEKGKKELLMKIMKYQLATLDIALFLDTHPNDPIALIRHNEYCTKLAQYKNEYTENYGPLDDYSADMSGTWRYLDAPWPWEQEF
jgi:spore coat protein JB